MRSIVAWIAGLASALLLGGCAQLRYRQIEKSHLPSQELAEEGGKAVLPAGKALRPVTAAGLKMTEGAEGWIPHLYEDVALYCTIGYGHLVEGRRSCKEISDDRRAEFGHDLTLAQGETLLVGDMATAQYTVMTAVRIELTDGQFSALSDFVFNVGSANFRASTLLKVINARQMDRVAQQFRVWVLAKGKPWPGLIKRREAEIDLYFAGQPQPRGLPLAGEDLRLRDYETGQPES